jgi:hypothetical protein
MKANIFLFKHPTTDTADHNPFTRIAMSSYQPPAPKVQQQDLKGKVAVVTYASHLSCALFLPAFLSVDQIFSCEMCHGRI